MLDSANNFMNELLRYFIIVGALPAVLIANFLTLTLFSGSFTKIGTKCLNVRKINLRVGTNCHFCAQWLIVGDDQEHKYILKY